MPLLARSHQKVAKMHLSAMFVCPQVTTRILPDGFSRNLILESSTSIYRYIQIFVKIGQKTTETSHEDLQASLRAFPVELAKCLSVRKVFGTDVVGEEYNTYFMPILSYTFPLTLTIFRIIKQK
jgi:hypothetical protein